MFLLLFPGTYLTPAKAISVIFYNLVVCTVAAVLWCPPISWDIAGMRSRLSSTARRALSGCKGKACDIAGIGEFHINEFDQTDPSMSKISMHATCAMNFQGCPRTHGSI